MRAKQPKQTELNVHPEAPNALYNAIPNTENGNAGQIVIEGGESAVIEKESDEKKQRLRAYNRKYYSTPKWKAYHKKYHKIYYNTPEWKQRLRDYNKIYNKLPEVVERRKEWSRLREQTPERKLYQKIRRARIKVEKLKQKIKENTTHSLKNECVSVGLGANINLSYNGKE